jgi:hypothetical protein
VAILRGWAKLIEHNPLAAIDLTEDQAEHLTRVIEQQGKAHHRARSDQFVPNVRQVARAVRHVVPAGIVAQSNQSAAGKCLDDDVPVHSVSLHQLIADDRHSRTSCPSGIAHREVVRLGVGLQTPDWPHERLHGALTLFSTASERAVAEAAIVSSAQDWALAQQPGRSGNGQAVDRLATVADRAAASGDSRVTQMKADKVAKANPELAKVGKR